MRVMIHNPKTKVVSLHTVERLGTESIDVRCLADPTKPAHTLRKCADGLWQFKDREPVYIYHLTLL